MENKKNMRILKECNFVTKVLISIIEYTASLYSYVDKEDSNYSWTHLKEISGSKLLVSLHHSLYKCANIEVFNLTNKGSPEKIYQFDEVIGGRFTTSNYPNRFFLLLLTNTTLDN